MNYIPNTIKVSKYWDYKDEKINNNQEPQINSIIEYRKNAFSKVMTGEWTEEEYKKFSSIIKKTTVEKFYEHIEIAKVLLEMNISESSKELSHLIKTGFISNKNIISSTPEKLADLICLILSRLFSISNTSLTDEEKNNNNYTLDERITLFENILEQIQNPNSDYYNTYMEFFTEWVTKTFNNEELKNILLNQQDKIIKKKEKNLKEYLKKLYFEKKCKEVGSQYNHQRALALLDKQAKIRTRKIH